MKPLCEKIYFDKIIEIIVVLFGTFIDLMFIIHNGNDPMWFIIIIPFTAILILLTIDSIHWIFQPNVLIYQYETGIIIHRNIKVEYTSIDRVYHKNYIHKKLRGNYYKDTWSGIIFIRLKSGKIYKIRNAYYPLETIDVLSQIKRQKKFR